MSRRALITGVLGQDGTYLTQLLAAKGYTVFGTSRRPAAEGAQSERLRWLGVDHGVTLRQADLGDLSGLLRLLEETQPDEVYNLAAQSFVGGSWRQPLLTAQSTAMGAANMLEAVRIAAPHARFYQASSSEMFGQTAQAVHSETAACHPRSPYGVAKLFAHWLTVNYRESFGLHASSGILFNHESPLRGPEFVTRKISLAVARIACGRQDKLALGDIEVRRDWGHARDYVQAMWRMLQQDAPDDYVIATGRATSLRELCACAFARAGLRMEDHLVIDPDLLRPADVVELRGDPAKAAARLGWTAHTSLEALVAEMVDADLVRVREDVH